MKEIPGLFDVNSDLQIASPEVMVDIDRDHASSMGVTADKIEDALYDAFGSGQVSDIYTPTNDYWVHAWSCCRATRWIRRHCTCCTFDPNGQAGSAGRGDQAAQHAWARCR